MKYFVAILCMAVAASAASIQDVHSISRVSDGHFQQLFVRATACPSSAGGSKLSSAERKAFVKEHNNCRQKEGAGLSDLSWDDSLAKKSQDLVNRQSNCDMQHMMTECDGHYIGQNLAWDWASNAPSSQMSASKAVTMWYDEKSDYNMRSGSCRSGKMCGHYTQIVWKGTKKVGCAARICGNSRLVACDYYPAGNWQGQKPY